MVSHAFKQNPIKIPYQAPQYGRTWDDNHAKHVCLMVEFIFLHDNDRIITFFLISKICFNNRTLFRIKIITILLFFPCIIKF